MSQPGQAASASGVDTATQLGEIEVSIVLPCLNEVATLAGCIHQAEHLLRRIGLPGEIILADNGSSDGSAALAAELGARVVAVDEPGYGSALIAGLRAAAGHYLVMADADASYDLLEAAPMLERLRAGADLVVGSRLRGTINPGAMPWKNRYIGNPVLTGTLNALFHAGISDAHCGIRAFSRDAFQRMDLRCSGMEFASEMIVKATLLDLKMEEVAVSYYPDGRDRPPHLRPWRDGWRHLRFLLLYSPVRMYLIPGLALFLVGAGLNTFLALLPETAYLSFGRFFFGTHWTVPATLAAIFGLQTAFLGLITVQYSVQRGLYPPTHWSRWATRVLSLERLLVAGGLVALIGMAIETRIVLAWVASGYGALTELRHAVFGLMWILLGAVLVYNSFILGLLTHEVRTIAPEGDRATS